MEHAAEAIGEDLAARDQRSRAVAVMGKPAPIIYVQIDGTGVPVVKKQIIYDRVPFTHEDENGGVGKRSAGLASGDSS